MQFDGQDVEEREVKKHTWTEGEVERCGANDRLSQSRGRAEVRAGLQSCPESS